MTPPHAIGQYRIVEQLGEGGQGVVYLGVAPDGKRVAIKVLREGVAGDGRFAKEIAAARRVEPFCIAQVLDASLGGRPYIVTEYVEGPSLAAAGLHQGADLQRLAVATATALAAVHRAGVVHRDFKPANVLLGRDGPRVIDFGIARAMDDAVTRTSTIVGTPAYMAPEQFLGAVAGPTVDVFAWGSVMVFAATGAPPFGNDSLPAVLRRIQYEEPRLDGVPEPLRSIVYACLAKDPAARPAMQDVLFRLIGAPAEAGRPPADPGRAPGFAGARVPGMGDGVGLPGMGRAAGLPGIGDAAGLPGMGDAAGLPSKGTWAESPGAGARPGPRGTVGSQGGIAAGPTHPPSPAWNGHLAQAPTGPVRNPSRDRLITALLAAGTAIIVTGGAAAAWFLLPTSSGDGTSSAAIATATPATPTTASHPAGKAKKSAKPLRPTRTPTPSVRPKTPTTQPTRTPSTTPATTRPPTSPKPTAGGVKSVAFDYEGIRLGDCWRYDMNIWAKVAASGTYSYRWLVNGQSQGRQQGTASSKPLLPSITWKQAGTYQVVFEIVTPNPSRKSLSVKICDFDEGW
ncbi:protein kinase [Nonomuraea sp. PA05]|uniref:serine/threonine protein kinase n=1 Tax=Nonomuraea sp. PA05 TaxID=2604466 RepID=UPI0011DADD93|nr:serine/threonine-protein kinase [Nonomuraea sp. PA05]TYB67645.1 protein kinase [Nonomuraea sp. PA05]